MTKEDVDKMLDNASTMQEEMHSIVAFIMDKNPNGIYQDGVNVFILMKLSELKNEIDKINNYLNKVKTYNINN
jgi:hypothetical protein